MSDCAYCGKELGPKPVGGACEECARGIGAVPMPESRRPRVPCARCGGRRFVRSIPFTTLMVGTKIVVAPRAVTYALTKKVTRIGIATYTCTHCGSLEEYCEDPERIPIAAENMTDVVDYGGDDGPFR